MPDIHAHCPAPVHDHPEDPKQPTDGIALCMSGGGYRAMLFHLGIAVAAERVALSCPSSTESRASPAAPSPTACWR